MDPQDTSVALVLTLVLSLLKFGSGQWQVIGPEKMVQVLVGEDAVFSCSLAPETNAEAMEVRFFRDQFSAVIHLYRDGKDQNDIQIPDYRGRTELLKDSLGNGRVSLRLKKVTLSDAGLYGCWFKSRTYEQNTSWDMQVSALGSAPLISMIGYFHGGIQLLCKSSGWFPKPIVKWKNSHEHNFPSDTKVNTDKHGLFDVETSFTIQENSGSISCSVQLTNNSQELESRIWIGDTFFQPIFQRLVFISLGVLCSVLFVYIIFHSIFKDQRKHHGQAELREMKKHAVQVTLGTDTSGNDSGHRHCSPVEVTLDTGTSGDDFGRKHGSPVEVTLDTDMAHPQLYISGLKSVIYRKTLKVMPYLEKRFNSMCVVAIQGFRAGKHYWEVDVGHIERWYLGVCRDDVDREEENVTLSPNNGYWVLGGERDQYFTLYPHRISLCLGFPPTRVGVFLDYEGGTISFYNTNDQSFICTLTHQFEGLLRPYIWHQKLDEEM